MLGRNRLAHKRWSVAYLSLLAIYRISARQHPLPYWRISPAIGRYHPGSPARAAATHTILHYLFPLWLC